MSKLQTLALATLGVAFVASTASADVLGYWRFEEGPADANVSKGGAANGDFFGAVQDYSGNGNNLSAWSEGDFAGYAYRTNTPFSSVPNTGAANMFSVQNTGGAPGMFTIDSDGMASNPASPLHNANFAAWTVEASWLPETGGFRTVVGRDGRDVATDNGAVAPSYLQALGGDDQGALAVKFADADGFFHVAQTAPGFMSAFAWDPATQTPDDGTWMNIAARSDGSTLDLIVNGTVVASTDIAASGSTNTALVADTDFMSGDSRGGGWSVGRGMFDGGHGDRAYGLIDEVRISNNYFGDADLLQNVAVPEPTSLGLLVAGLPLVLRRRR